MSYGPRFTGTVRPSYNGPKAPKAFSFGIGNSGERGVASIDDMSVQPNRSFEHVMKQAYSMGITKNPNDFEMDQGFLVENEDFADVFDMPEFDEVFIARANAKNGWIGEVMPPKQTDKLDIGGDCLIFNHTQPERLPEEAVPNYMTHEREKWSDTIIRMGKGITMEKNFYMTLFGRMMFYFQLEQLNNAVMMAQAHSCLCAMYYDERKNIKKRSDRVQENLDRLGDGCSATQLMKEAYKNWGVLNREPTQIAERVAEWTRIFTSENDNKTPTRIIFPDGCQHTWKYADLGSYAQSGWRLGEKPNLQQIAANGLKYNESWGTRLDDSRIIHDPAYSERTIGSFFVINRSCYYGNKFEVEATNVELFNESQDQMNLFKLEHNLKYTGAWHNYDECDTHKSNRQPSYLSNIGQAYMAGCTNYWDLYKRQAPRRELDDICKKILEQPTFVQRIVERIEENQDVYHRSNRSANIEDPLSKNNLRQKLSQIVPNIYVSSSRKQEAKYPDPEAAPVQAAAQARASDWLQSMARKFDIDVDSKTKALYEKIKRSKDSDEILMNWEAIADQQNGENFYNIGKEIVDHIGVNNTLKRALQSKVSPASLTEFYLRKQDLSQVDQPWLDELEDLDEMERSDLKYFGNDNLVLLTNDDTRTLNYASLLFPLSTQNVVLFHQDDLQFMKDADWNKKIFTNTSNERTKKFFNSSLRMTHLFHSIEVSVIYACIEQKMPYKNNMVKNTTPNPKLIDWDNQIKSIRNSRLPLADYQSKYQGQVDRIRKFIQNPTSSAYARLVSEIEQSKTSATIYQYPSFSLAERVNKAGLKDENGAPFELNKFQMSYHGPDAKPDEWVLNKHEDLKEPLKGHFFDKVNQLYDVQGNFNKVMFEDFVTSLSTNVLLLQATTISIRFADTPLQNMTNANFVRCYIDAAVAFAITDLAQATRFLDSERKTILLNSKKDNPVKFRENFTGILNTVLTVANDLNSAVTFNITTQFSNWRSGAEKQLLKKGNAGFEALADEFVKGISWLNEADFKNNQYVFKREAKLLVSYVFAFKSMNSVNDLNIVDQIFEKTEIAKEVRDLRSMKSQSIAAMLLAVAVYGLVPIEAGSSPTAIATSLFKALEQSAYVSSKLGGWSANSDNIVTALSVMISNNPGEPKVVPLGFNESVRAASQLGLWKTKFNAARFTTAASSEANPDVAVSLEDIANLLSLVTTEDAWLLKRTFEYSIPPPCGIMGYRPHATYEMGTVLLVSDNVGNLYYMPPSISAGEDHRTMMMHMTFAMYYKGVLNGGKNLIRIPDVFCRQYLGGNGLQVWDPLNPEDIAMYRSSAPGTDTKRDMFVRLIDYYSEYTNNVMDITGIFPLEVKCTDKEAMECSYSASKVLCETWGWENARCMEPDTYKNRVEYVPRFNTIMMQDHVGRWDGNGKYTNIIRNAGAWAQRIYDGCSRERCGGTLTKDFPVLMK